MNFISIYSNLLKYFIFVHLLLIEDYKQGALRKDLIIVPSVDGLKEPLWESLTNIYHFCYASQVKHFISLTFCWQKAMERMLYVTSRSLPLS